MTGQMLKDGDSLRLGFFLVALVDLLGQREELRKLTGLPKAADPNDPIVRALKSTWGAVHLVRSMFLAHFEACSQESGFAQSLGPAQREALRRVMKAEIVNYGFSDSVIIAVALEAKPGDPTPVNGVWQTLLAVGTTATLSLAAKHPLRAGIDVGVAVRVSDHEIYGAASERAYTLESHCAQHPRIVVGQELLSYLRQVKDQPHDTTEAQIGSLRAESALRFIFQDADGQPALDYLGSEVHDVVAASLTPATVQQAYDFVVSEQARWRAGGNEGRADRYRKVREYFESRAELWGIATR